jgi:hypothetical protein
VETGKYKWGNERIPGTSDDESQHAVAPKVTDQQFSHPVIQCGYEG